MKKYKAGMTKKTDKIKYPEEFKKIINEIDPMPK